MSRKKATPALVSDGLIAPEFTVSGRGASLEDVAALAGVSAGTVSRALSRPEMISESTRLRVQKAVERVGYVPNGAARAMAMRCTMTVGAIIPRFGGSSFATMVQALELTLARAGYTLLLAAPDHLGPEPVELVRKVLARGVDALALLGSQHPTEVFTMLAQRATPFVQLWTQDAHQGPCVGFDEQHAAALLIEFLAAHGHRTIGFIGGHQAGNERAQVRFAGLTRAIAKHGLMLRDEAVLQVKYGFREGFDAMQSVIAAATDVTAMVCGNDYLAAGALAALDQCGVGVPGQMSVVSFNDNDFAPFLHPPLTTVHLPIQEIGEAGAQLLLSRLRNESYPAATNLPVALIERGSAGPAPAVAGRPSSRRKV
jgi:LacI family transcriptional regulator